MIDKGRMLLDKNAVSEVVGYIILLGTVITAIGIIYMLAVPQISNSQSQAQFQNAEQAFTILDTHASKAQYSNYLSQVSEMSLNGGTLKVNGSAGHIYIIRKDPISGTETTIYGNNPGEGSLGAIVYTINGREVGYQDGGIWEKYPDGGSVMVSAPDFNYNGETHSDTLTLPLMQIVGNSTLSGTGKAFITTKSDNKPIIIYPSREKGENPIDVGQVIIKIQTDYYKAWENYINERTDCSAVSYSNNRTVVITFNTKQKGGTYPFTPPIKIVGLNTSNPNPFNKFYLNLTTQGSIENINFGLIATGSNADLEIHFQKAGGHGTDGLRWIISYQYDGVNEVFYSEPYVVNHADDFCNMTLTDTGKMTYYGSITTFNSDSASSTWGTTYHDGDTGPSVNDVIQHYLVLAAQNTPGGTGTFSLDYSPDHSSKKPISPSTYTLDYDAKNVLRYMHVTNNPMNVTMG
jgi:hypothetical protein